MLDTKPKGYQITAAALVMGDSICGIICFSFILLFANLGWPWEELFSLMVSCEQTNTFINDLTKKGVGLKYIFIGSWLFFENILFFVVLECLIVGKPECSFAHGKMSDEWASIAYAQILIHKHAHTTVAWFYHLMHLKTTHLLIKKDATIGPPNRLCSVKVLLQVFIVTSYTARTLSNKPTLRQSNLHFPNKVNIYIFFLWMLCFAWVWSFSMLRISHDLLKVSISVGNSYMGQFFVFILVPTGTHASPHSNTLTTPPRSAKASPDCVTVQSW